ncbi:MAG: ArnT family glycosyltransferase [Planctomycetota bacterium]
MAFALIVIALYAAGINSYWRFQRDSALYMGLARSLAETGAYSFNYRPHAFAWPGFPAMLSVIYMAAGESFPAMNALVSLCGLGCVAVAWLLLGELSLSDRQLTACLLLVGFSRNLYYYSCHIMPDVPFTFAVIVGLYCGTKMLSEDGTVDWLWCLGAAAAACAASFLRPLGPVLVIALIAALWLRPAKMKRWTANLGWTAVLAGPFVVFGSAWGWRSSHVRAAANALSPGQARPARGYFEAFVSRWRLPKLASRVSEGAFELVDTLSEAVLGVDLGLPVSVALALLLAIGLVAALRRGERLLSAYGVVYLGAVCLGSPGRRYLLPALPVLVYWLVLGAGEIGFVLSERWHVCSRRCLLRAGKVLLMLAVALNLLRVGKVIYKARSPDFYSAMESGSLPHYFQLANWLGDNAGGGDCVYAYEDRLLHYFGRARTVRGPSLTRGFDVERAARFLASEGVTYMVVDRTEGHRYKQRMKGRMDELRRCYPQAFGPLRTFGMLELLRVYPDRLTGARQEEGGTQQSTDSPVP